jgi:hypothetical protein
MVLRGESTIFKRGKARTLYCSIPSKMALDSQFPIREGDTVILAFSPRLKELRIYQKKDEDKAWEFTKT